MMATGLVEDYLRELRSELRDIPRSRQRELLDEIRAHIATALEHGSTHDEAEIRTILDRVGDPADIAAEARDRFGAPRATPGGVETAALILLPIGGIILPILGWLIGVAMLWSSKVWTTAEKLAGTLLLPGGLLPAVMLMTFSGRTCVAVEESAGTIVTECSGGLPPALAWVLLAILVVTPLVTMAFLARRMRRPSPAP